MTNKTGMGRGTSLPDYKASDTPEKPKEKVIEKPKPTDTGDEPEDDEEEYETTTPTEETKTTKFEETGDGIEEIPEPEPEEHFEYEINIEDLDAIRYEFDTGLKALSKELKDLIAKVAEKDEIIKVLSTKNIDLINIDMELISNELHKSEVKLNNIATEKQFERLNELENTKGINMAYKVSRLYLEHAGTEAKLTIPTLNLIKISLEKISEKLRYVSDKDV